jgi:hypothetical protein
MGVPWVVAHPRVFFSLTERFHNIDLQQRNTNMLIEFTHSSGELWIISSVL